MRSSGLVSGSTTSLDGDPLDLPEHRDALLIHVQSLMESADRDPRAVADEATAVVATARRRGDPELLGMSLRVLAWTHRALWDEGSARRMLDEAVRVSRRHGLPHVEASALVSRATVLQDAGRVAAAARDLDAALAAMERAPYVEPRERALFLGRVRLSRAVIDHNAGRRAAAERRYRELLADFELDDTRVVIATNNLAQVLAERGAHAEAVERADAAVELCASAPGLLAPALQTRAWILVRAGRLAEGMQQFDRAAKAYADAGIPLGEYYLEYADAMTDLRLLPEAQDATAHALRELEESGAPLMVTEARLRLARIALLSGDTALAEELAEQARQSASAQRRIGWRDRAELVAVEARQRRRQADRVDLVRVRRTARRLERSGDQRTAIEAYLAAGRVALDLGAGPEARALLRRTAELAQSGQVLERLAGRVAEALAARAAGRPDEVVAACQAGLRDLSQHRSGLPTVELRALASGHGAELGEIGLGVAAGTGSAARVLSWMERTRAAALAGRLPTATGGSDMNGAPDAATGAAAAERSSATHWARGNAAGGVAGADQRPVSSAELRRVLGPRTLVEFGVADGRLIAVVVTRGGARLVRLGAVAEVEEQVRPLLFALRRMANPRGRDAADAARASAELRLDRLRQLLVEPLGVRRDDELVVVPVGVLHTVPWSPLHDGPLAQAPSASFWVRARASDAARTASGRTVLVAGPDLAGAREEVEALVVLHPEAVLLPPERSTSSTVLEALVDADLAHLACHGIPRSDSPMFSSLLLADGPVTLQAIDGASSTPHRLVLASCHAGADVNYLGDEVLGFVSVMLARGCAGVVASIGAVPDVASVDLMTELHRGLLAGMTMARALHAARAATDRSSPEGFVNWCTFSAHGAA